MHKALFGAFLLLAACKKKQEVSVPAATYNAADFVGTWRIVSRTSAGAFNWGGVTIPTNNMLAGDQDCIVNMRLMLDQSRDAQIILCAQDYRYASWDVAGDQFRYRMTPADAYTSHTIKTKTTISFTLTYAVQPPPPYSGRSTTVTEVFGKL